MMECKSLYGKTIQVLYYNIMKAKKKIIIKGSTVKYIQPRPDIKKDKDAGNYIASWINDDESVCEVSGKTQQEAMLLWWKKFGGG